MTATHPSPTTAPTATCSAVLLSPPPAPLRSTASSHLLSLRRTTHPPHANAPVVAHRGIHLPASSVRHASSAPPPPPLCARRASAKYRAMNMLESAVRMPRLTQLATMRPSAPHALPPRPMSAQTVPANAAAQSTIHALPRAIHLGGATAWKKASVRPLRARKGSERA